MKPTALHAAARCPYSCMFILTVIIRSNSDFNPMSRPEGALSKHLSGSRYATLLIEARPALADELDAQGHQPFSRAAIDAALETVKGASEDETRGASCASCGRGSSCA